MAKKTKRQEDKPVSTKGLPTWIGTILHSDKTTYVILFLAYFHAVLRVPVVGGLTFFRILLPVSVLLIGVHSLKTIAAISGAVAGMMAISLVQSCLCQKFYYPEIVFSMSNLVQFWIHYASIFVFCGLLITLWRKEGDAFYGRFASFHTVIIKCAMICDAVWLLFSGNYKGFSLFGNVNNFGCAMVVGVALILCSESKVYWKCLWTGMAAVLLYANDSKIALLGLLIELCIYLIVWIEKNVIDKNRTAMRATDKRTDATQRARARGYIFAHWRGVCAAVFGVAVILVLTSPIRIHGYNIKEMTQGALRQVFTGRYYEHSTSSLQFRANAVIGLGDVLENSCLLGVGAGNSGIILRQILPDMNVLFEDRIFVSSHIWWLEVFSDFGLFSIIPAILIFAAQLVCFFKCRYRSRFNLFQTMVLISFPIWCMSAAGLYTDFYTLSVMIVATIGTGRTIWSQWRNREQGL